LSTNLRILLDEAITDVLADEIRHCSSAINVEYMRELPIKGAKDPAVIDYAKKHEPYHGNWYESQDVPDMHPSGHYRTLR